MFYSKVIDLIRKHLGDELVTEAELYNYIDRVIDDINVQLNTCFPTFTEFSEENYGIGSNLLDYNAIPDKYLRTVVVPGAAFKYYTTDEEGGNAAPKYEEDYRQGLFYMLRDYSFSIPSKYRADEQGFIDVEEETPGITVAFRGGLY